MRSDWSLFLLPRSFIVFHKPQRRQSELWPNTRRSCTPRPLFGPSFPCSTISVSLGRKECQGRNCTTRKESNGNQFSCCALHRRESRHEHKIVRWHNRQTHNTLIGWFKMKSEIRTLFAKRLYLSGRADSHLVERFTLQIWSMNDFATIEPSLGQMVIRSSKVRYLFVWHCR